MAIPKAFVSSTALDLSTVREAVGSVIQKLGYEPVMFERSDILYDSMQHTQVSCIEAVEDVDLFVLIIGGRFGETARPAALAAATVDQRSVSAEPTPTGPAESISVTQAEAERALSLGIPVVPFVNRRVMHDLQVYRENPTADLTFPSIEDQRTARGIFDFIERLRSRDNNNGIFEFDNLADIEATLTHQWAQLFRKLLRERRDWTAQQRQLENMAEQFESLKVAVLASIPEGDSRAAAYGVTRYRSLMEFLLELPEFDASATESYPVLLGDVLRSIGVRSISTQPREVGRSLKLLLRFEDGSGLLAPSTVSFERLSDDWSGFRAVNVVTRSIISEILSDDLLGSRVRGTRQSTEAVDELIRTWQRDEVGPAMRVLSRPGEFGSVLSFDPTRPMAEATEHLI